MKKYSLFNSDDEIIIKPIQRFGGIDIGELWRYRELFLTFTWRDIKVRYRQTFLGVSWAIIPPVLSMIIFSVIFGNFLGISSEGTPYPVFVYTGTLLWTYFSRSLTKTSNSLVSHRSMIQKIYFPRIILPLSSIIAGLLDFSISLIILFLLMVYFQIYPNLLVGIPITLFILIITILTSLGFGLFFSAVNVRYRDVKQALPFLTQLGFFITPVVYPVTSFKEWSFLLWFNPMAGVIKNARAALLGTGPIEWNLLFFSLIISIICFILGVFYFKLVEKDFADVI
ncbi:MAG: ABC transporter permease [Candidatus Hodarchaeota archaeon]